MFSVMARWKEGFSYVVPKLMQLTEVPPGGVLFLTFFFLDTKEERTS